jgi:hypothetical protein
MSIVVAAKITSDAKKQSQHKVPERIGTGLQHPHPLLKHMKPIT